jgi:hypothetical protein
VKFSKIFNYQFVELNPLKIDIFTMVIYVVFGNYPRNCFRKMASVNCTYVKQDNILANKKMEIG